MTTIAAWSVDGRSGRVPMPEPDPLTPEEFEVALVDVVVGNSGRIYTIPSELDQQAARKYHGTWMKYYSFFGWKFPSYLLEIAGRCPYVDVRRELINDCIDEEVGDADVDGRTHFDVLLQEAEFCGVPRDEVVHAEATPPLLLGLHAFDNLARTLSWQASLAALGSLELKQSKPAIEARQRLWSAERITAARAAFEGPPVAARLGVAREDLVFLALHAYKDEFHGGGQLALLVKYGVDALVQQEMLWAAKAGTIVMEVVTEELRRLSLEAVGLPLDYDSVAVSQGDRSA